MIHKTVNDNDEVGGCGSGWFIVEEEVIQNLPLPLFKHDLRHEKGVSQNVLTFLTRGMS